MNNLDALTLQLLTSKRFTTIICLPPIKTLRKKTKNIKTLLQTINNVLKTQLCDI